MPDLINKYLNSQYYRALVVFYVLFVSMVIIFSTDIPGPLYSFTNRSDSMNPTIDQGSITIVKNSEKYLVGEVIAYFSLIDGHEEITTHRIMGIGGNVYTTKGDANAATDRELVRPRLIIGKVVMIIPYLGYVIAFAKSLLGTWLCIIFPAAIIVGSESTRIFIESKRTVD